MKKFEKLEKLRQSKKITLEELAKKVGVSKQYLWDLESGRRVLSYLMACKIALALDVTPDELFLDDLKKRK